MREFKVKLKGGLLSTTKIVQASSFEVHLLTNNIIFTDMEGKNIALFNRFDVENIEYTTNDKVLSSSDLEKINTAIIRNPIGSYEMGEVARLAGILKMNGIDPIPILTRPCIIKGIDWAEGE